MGPEVGQIQGRLVERDSARFVVAVSAVQYLRGNSQAWAGADVPLKSEDVSRYYQVTFDRPRTIAVTAAVLGATALMYKVFFSPGSSGLPTTDQGAAPIQRSPRGKLHIPLQPVQTVRIIQRLLPYFVRP
jgi:hypothetical protein